MNVKNRTIFCKDNLDVLQGINSDSIDLIYLDPPFNKKKTFTAPIGSCAEGASFKDIFREADVKEEWLKTIREDNHKLHTFLESVKTIEGRTSYNFCYLAYMAIRLMEMHRILKDTGSLYLHCDPTMSHYLKIVMDILFGEKNFRNEIVWNYSKSKGYVSPKNQFPRKHDIVFFYTKTVNHVFNKQRQKENRSIEELKKKYAGDYFYCDPDGFIHWKTIKEKTKNYVSRWRKVFQREFNRDPVDTDKIFIIRDPIVKSVWDDIPFLNPSQKSKERIDYPTQKPIKLLERIIQASSNEGDMVLDPFCGCGTTCVASEKLGRQWIGIDVSHKAYELVRQRLDKEIKYPKKGQVKLLDWSKVVEYATIPPKRTDTDEDERLK